MNASQIISTLSQGVSFIRGFGPLASIAGGPIVGSALAIAETLTTVAMNVEARIAEGSMVASSTSQDELAGVLTALAEVNDKLNAAIVAS